MSRRQRQHQGGPLTGHRQQTREDRAAADALAAAAGCPRCERPGVALEAVPVPVGFQVRCLNRTACDEAVRALLRADREAAGS